MRTFYASSPSTTLHLKRVYIGQHVSTRLVTSYNNHKMKGELINQIFDEKIPVEDVMYLIAIHTNVFGEYFVFTNAMTVPAFSHF